MRRGLVATRGEARRLIERGGVVVGGRPSARPATMVAADEPIELDDAPRWASRAGGKLEAALDHFGVDPEARDCLDVGASTGGFTDVLLDRGAARVVALDVGYGQLIWRLRTDPRVEVLDRTNFRTADTSSLGGPFSLVTVDVSFISVTLLASNLAAVTSPGADYIVLVKPQFEVGREHVGRGGVVDSPELHGAAISSVAEALTGAGIAPRGVLRSPVVGAAGNQEFLLHGIAGGDSVASDSLLSEVAL